MSSNHPSIRARLRRMCQHRIVLENGKCLVCGKQRQPPKPERPHLRKAWDTDEDEDPRDWRKVDPSNPLRR